MLPKAINRKLLYGFIFPYDINSDSRDIISEEDREILEPGEIARDKLKDRIVDENGHLSKEVQSVITLTGLGAFGGLIFGGIFRAKHAGQRFIEENSAAVFENKLIAQKELQKKLAYEFLRGGKSLAAKMGMFCFLFSGTATCLYIVRNKFTVSNYTYAGITTGTLMKLNMGIKGACSGAFVGGVLGSIYGSITAIILYITRTEMDDVISQYSNWMTAKKKAMHKKMHNVLNDEELYLKHTYNVNRELKKLEEQHKNEVQKEK